MTVDNNDLTQRLEKLEDRLETFAHDVNTRLARLEEDLARLRSRITRMPESEEKGVILGEIDNMTDQTLELSKNVEGREG